LGSEELEEVTKLGMVASSRKEQTLIKGRSLLGKESIKLSFNSSETCKDNEIGHIPAAMSWESCDSLSILCGQKG